MIVPHAPYARRSSAAAKNASSPWAKGSVRSMPLSSSRGVRGDGGSSPKIDSHEVGVLRKEGFDHCFVLLGLARAGGVYEAPSGSNDGGGAVQNLELVVGEHLEVVLLSSPSDVRIASNRTEAGTGGIYEHAIEARLKWKLAGGGQTHDSNVFDAARANGPAQQPYAT